jgi:hypothetical protein
MGVFLAGNSRQARGKLINAVGGSLLGTIAAIAVSAPLIGDESGVGVYIAMAAFAILPPFGAVILFDQSLEPRQLPAGRALFNFSADRFGMGIPEIQARPVGFLTRNMKPQLQVSVRVLSVEL